MAFVDTQNIVLLEEDRQMLFETALCHQQDCRQLQNYFVLASKNPRLPFQMVFSFCLLCCFLPCNMAFPAFIAPACPAFFSEFPTLLPPFLTFSCPSYRAACKPSALLPAVPPRYCSKGTDSWKLNYWLFSAHLNPSSQMPDNSSPQMF